MTVRLVQVTNVSTSVTKEQLKSLFTHLGRIDEIQLYPESETLLASVGAKVGYIRFDRSDLAQAALNLTTTVFLDRPIICSLVRHGGSSSSSANYRIPDETEALAYCAPLSANISLIPGGATWPHSVLNRLVTVTGQAGMPNTTFIETIDPYLAERSLPPYPHLPGTMDQVKAEEIRRTVFVSNLDPRVTFEHLSELFSQIGEIRFIRMTKSIHGIAYDNLGTNKPITAPPESNIDLEVDSVGAFIEFSEQPSIVKALCLNGLVFAGRQIKVNHATSSVIIPATDKLHISLDDLRKESGRSKSKSSHKESSSRHSSSRGHSSSHRSSSHRKPRRSGSASSSGSEGSEEEEDEDESNESSGESSSSSSRESSPPPSPPRKQHRSSRSRSESKSKSKRKSKSPIII